MTSFLLHFDAAGQPAGLTAVEPATDAKPVVPTFGHLPECAGDAFGSYPEDGACPCGVYKHHVHCVCGGVTQVG